MHNENSKKSQVGSSLFACFFVFFSSTPIASVLSYILFPITVKLKENLDCCFQKEESGDLELEIKRNSPELAQSSRCLLRMFVKECL